MPRIRFWLVAAALCPCTLLALLGSFSRLAGGRRALPLHAVGLLGVCIPSGWWPPRFALTSCWASWVLSPFWLVAAKLWPLHASGPLGFFLLSGWWPPRLALTCCRACWVLPLFWLGAPTLCPYTLSGEFGSSRFLSEACASRRNTWGTNVMGL